MRYPLRENPSSTPSGGPTSLPSTPAQLSSGAAPSRDLQLQAAKGLVSQMPKFQSPRADWAGLIPRSFPPVGSAGPAVSAQRPRGKSEPRLGRPAPCVKPVRADPSGPASSAWGGRGRHFKKKKTSETRRDLGTARVCLTLLLAQLQKALGGVPDVSSQSTSPAPPEGHPRLFLQPRQLPSSMLGRPWTPLGRG